MPYLTSNLITDAYYLSSIVSRDFETATGDQMSDGLRLLNDLLADRSIDNGTIPYSKKELITATPGVSIYPIPYLINMEIFVFYIQSIRYETMNEQRHEFFGTFRATAIQSLPFKWHFERNLSGGTLYLYFIPDVAYPMEVWGTFSLSSVTEFQDLSLTLDQFYTNFLKYLLAQRLCDYNSWATPQAVMLQIEKYYQWINKSTNVMDLRQRKVSSLAPKTAINYGLVNLSNGWVPV